MGLDLYSGVSGHGLKTRKGPLITGAVRSSVLHSGRPFCLRAGAGLRWDSFLPDQEGQPTGLRGGRVLGLLVEWEGLKAGRGLQGAEDTSPGEALGGPCSVCLTGVSRLSGLRGRWFPLSGTLFSFPASSLPICPSLTLAQAQATLPLLAGATQALSRSLCSGHALCLEYCSLPVLLAVSSLEGLFNTDLFKEATLFYSAT